MAKEIERKFLVAGALPDEAKTAPAFRINQGYLQLDKARQVRIRLQTSYSTDQSEAFLTVKGKATGITRSEYEYSIPVKDAFEMLKMVEGSTIEKVRMIYGPWEIDFFLRDNVGLIVAEIELPSEDTEFERPSWLGEEVSEDPRYANINLAKNPYKNWSKDASQQA
jgi:CYTH domain-containing protein